MIDAIEAHLGFDLRGKTLHVPRAFFRGFRQCPNFVGDHCETAAVVAGTRGLDRRIQRQQIGLVGNLADGLGDIADARRLFAQLRHDVDGPGLPVAVVLDIAGPGSDLARRLEQKRFDSLGSATCAFGAIARLHQCCRRVGGNREGFLCGAGSFLRSAGDLLHRTAQFLGGGRCLGDSRREFLRCCRNPLLNFLLLAAQDLGWRRLAARVGGDVGFEADCDPKAARSPPA